MRRVGPDLKDRIRFIASPGRWWQAIVGLLLGWLIASWANGAGTDAQLALWWTIWIDPMITSATLVVAILLSASAALRAWEDSLEKRLDVHCTYNGRYVASCWEATLAHEGDIRQWGQQIGSQMLGVRWLDFTVTPTFHPPVNRLDGAGARRVYTIEIELTVDPTHDGRYLVWDHRHAAGVRRFFAPERPDRPLEPSASELSVLDP